MKKIILTLILAIFILGGFVTADIYDCGDYPNEDYDSDGVINYQDNCCYIYNPFQKDYDNDGFGNPCDSSPGEEPTEAYCGDGICNGYETIFSCPIDCPQNQTENETKIDPNAPVCSKGIAKKVYSLTLIANDTDYSFLLNNISGFAGVKHYDGQEGEYIGKIVEGAYSEWGIDSYDTTKWGGGPGLVWASEVYTLYKTATNNHPRYGIYDLTFIGKHKLYSSANESEADNINFTRSFYHEGGPIYFWIHDWPVEYNRGQVSMELYYCDEEKSSNANNADFETFCEPIWECGDWSSCFEGTMQRECSDISFCDYAYNKPMTSTSCEMPISENSKTKIFSLTMNPILIFSLFVTLILIIALIFVISK